MCHRGLGGLISFLNLKIYHIQDYSGNVSRNIKRLENIWFAICYKETIALSKSENIF